MYVLDQRELHNYTTMHITKGRKSPLPTFRIILFLYKYVFLVKISQERDLVFWLLVTELFKVERQNFKIFEYFTNFRVNLESFHVIRVFQQLSTISIVLFLKGLFVKS